jgi:phage gpG-like protein
MADFSGVENMLKRLEQAIEDLPIQVGAEAVQFFDEGFDKQGWQGDSGLDPWQKRKDDADPERAILVGSAGGHLRNGINFRLTGQSVFVGVNGVAAEYADIHNTGGTTHPKVTTKSKAWAWAMYKATGRAKYKSMATTTKANLTVKIPQRKFIGTSLQLTKRLEKLVKLKITEAIK